MTLKSLPTSLCVFCGASNNVADHYLQKGTAFGKVMAERDIRLVFGGGDCGMMGAVSNAVMDNGGEATGVFPVSLRDLEDEHKGLTEIIIVNTMHERKQLMYERSDAFVIFPGGFGTMDEMFEILTWRQLRLHQKPVIIFNYKGYWDHLVGLMENIMAEKFAGQNTREFYTVVTEMDEVLPALGY